jgi:hypothetical protein
MTRTDPGMQEKERHMKRMSSESTGVSSHIVESESLGIAHGTSIGIGYAENTCISEGESNDDLSRSFSDDRPTSSSDDRPTTRSGSWQASEPQESVTILIEGGGFSFNDVFPMGSRNLAAENGRAIATFALSLVARRRRLSGRTVEE